MHCKRQHLGYKSSFEKDKGYYLDGGSHTPHMLSELLGLHHIAMSSRFLCLYARTFIQNYNVKLFYYQYQDSVSKQIYSRLYFITLIK